MTATKVFSAHRVGDKVDLYLDIIGDSPEAKTCQTANPITFKTRHLFTKDSGLPIVGLTREETEELIRELSGVLKEGE